MQVVAVPRVSIPRAKAEDAPEHASQGAGVAARLLHAKETAAVVEEERPHLALVDMIRHLEDALADQGVQLNAELHAAFLELVPMCAVPHVQLAIACRDVPAMGVSSFATSAAMRTYAKGPVYRFAEKIFVREAVRTHAQKGVMVIADLIHAKKHVLERVLTYAQHAQAHAPDIAIMHACQPK